MSNIDAATREIADKWVAIADEIAKKQTELKDLKAHAKDEGYNVRVIGQIVKEKRKGAKYQADQLTLELELTTYRSAVGLPTTVEDAQERARREAATMAEDEPSPIGEDDTVQFGDGPEIPAREFERAARNKRGRLQ